MSIDEDIQTLLKYVAKNGLWFAWLVQVEREVLPPTSDTTSAANTAASSHGIEVAVEFKPVEHPNEPLDNDRPIQCPLPEPSILNVSLFIDFLSGFFLY